VTYGADKDDNPMSQHKKEGFLNGDVFMVLDYIDYDLSGLLEHPGIILTEDHIKSYTKQILEGVFFMHKNNILHRDIKSANLLVTRDNQIKIADWGLARFYNAYEKSHKYTNPVVTLWYRAPELLLGLKEYGFGIDIWSVGCVFAEMKCKACIMKGQDESEQLSLIYQIFGSPNTDLLDLYKMYPKFNEITVPKVYEKSLRSKLPM
jgi:serine/threonine protein kinase